MKKILVCIAVNILFINVLYSQSLIERELCEFHKPQKDVIQVYCARISDTSGKADISKFRLVRNDKKVLSFNVVIEDGKHFRSKIYDANFDFYENEHHNYYKMGDSYPSFYLLIVCDNQLNVNLPCRYYVFGNNGEYFVRKIDERVVVDYANNSQNNDIEYLDSLFVCCEKQTIPLQDITMSQIISDINPNGNFGYKIDTEKTLEESFVTPISDYMALSLNQKCKVSIISYKERKFDYIVSAQCEDEYGNVIKRKFTVDKSDLWVNIFRN